MTDQAIASREDIAAYLARDTHLDATTADGWAAFLAGLPWRYVRPIVTIAVNTGNHPALALSTAAAFSEDAAFKAAAKSHLGRSGAGS